MPSLPKITMGDVAMTLKTVAILAILYLQFTKKIHIPLWILLLLTVASFALAHVSFQKKEHQTFNHHYQNLLTGILGLVVVIKDLM